MINAKIKKYNSNEYEFIEYDHFWIVNLKYAQVLQNNPNFHPTLLNDENNIVYYNGIKLMYFGCYDFEINNIPLIGLEEQICKPVGIFVLCDNIERIHHKHIEKSLDGNVTTIMVPNTKIILIDDINTLALIQNNEYYSADIEAGFVDIKKEAVGYIKDGDFVFPEYLNKFPNITYLGTLPAKSIDPERDGALKVGIYFINNKTNEN